MTTCTVGPDAVTHERCGKPAVLTMTGRNGEQFAECAEHAYELPAEPHGIVVGTIVEVLHAGRIKHGVVKRCPGVPMPGDRAVVEVPLADGTTKLITRRYDDLLLPS